MSATPSETLRTADRLMNALEALIGREGAVIRTGSGTGVRAVQARIAPVVARLAQVLSDPAAARYAAPRVARIVESRRRNTALMREALAGIRRRIDRNSDAMMRLRCMTPARGTRRPSAPAGGRRLNVSL